MAAPIILAATSCLEFLRRLYKDITIPFYGFNRPGAQWLGTASGLFRFDGVSFEHYAPAAGPAFPSQTVLSLLAMPNGDLWIGYTDGGASLLRQGTNVNYGAATGLPLGRVYAFARDSGGVLWAATDGGLGRFDKGRWESVGADWGYPGKTAHYVLTDRQGELWVASEKALFFLRQGSKRFEPSGNSITAVWQIRAMSRRSER
ncbi:MAG TPA: two-component regulator propeller domain-containing protein [Bryobacteraceae bacterium]|nr:two-component regulator propeller domain-containing protein [Bryobacteraceae bacterium]